MPGKKKELMSNLLYCYNPIKMLQVYLLDVLILLYNKAIAVPVFD